MAGNAGNAGNTGNAGNDQPPAPVRKLIKKTGSSFTPSIKDALSGKTANEPDQADYKHELLSANKADNPFTKEQLESKWTEYVGRLHERPGLRATLSRFPEITEGHILKLKIENSVYNDEIGKIKHDLVSWLRTELQNNSIELITEIEVQGSANKPFSESEKLLEMIKKNPNITLLRQKFNLDFGDV